MALPADLDTFDWLLLASGGLWTATYLLILRRAGRDRTYGMPIAALAANLAWEAIYTFLYPQNRMQQAVNGLWLLLDLGLLAQLLRYGPRELHGWTRARLALAFAGGFVMAGATILALGKDLNDHRAGIYAAFGQNLLMSVLFLQLLHVRRRLPPHDPVTGRDEPHPRGGLRGQSPLIALTKLLGTAAASGAFLWAVWDDPALRIAGSALLPLLYAAIFVADVVYLVLTIQLARPPHRRATPE